MGSETAIVVETHFNKPGNPTKKSYKPIFLNISNTLRWLGNIMAQTYPFVCCLQALDSSYLWCCSEIDQLIKWIHTKFGGKLVFEAKVFLFWLFIDLILDTSAAVVHFVQGRNTEGILTISIVVVAGCIVTLILHISIIRRNNYLTEAKERGISWTIFIFVPGLTPFYSGMLRLQYAKECVKYSEPLTPEQADSNKKVQSKMKKFVIGSTWDQMFEGFYENFPQAILQIVVMLEREIFHWSDLIAVVLILKAVKGIAMGPLNLSKACNDNKEITFVEEVIATMSKTVMLLCFAFSIVSWRYLFSNSLAFGTFAGVLMIIVFVDLPFIYIDGYAGRYPPVLKKEDEGNGNKNNKNKILSRLQKGYFIIFAVYGLIAVVYPSFWLYCDMVNFDSTQERTIFRAVVMCVYFATLIASLSLYVLKRDKLWLGSFFPYFLGMFIVRIVRRFYKVKGRLDDFGNGDYIHNLIGT